MTIVLCLFSSYRLIIKFQFKKPYGIFVKDLSSVFFCQKFKALQLLYTLFYTIGPVHGIGTEHDSVDKACTFRLE